MLEETRNMINTYSNPFEEINANFIDSKTIVEYWCNPFDSGVLTNSDEQKFRHSKLPIILQGSRGSGKTTILKYYSFPAQIERTEIANEKSVLKRIKEEGEVGFYFRCEESFVSTFSSIFKTVDKDNWTDIFECYIELLLSVKILEMVEVLLKRNEIQPMSPDSIKKILSLIGDDYSEDDISFQYLLDLFQNGVLYFEQYKNRIVFSDEKFQPNVFVKIFAISSIIVKELKKANPILNKVQFLLMIDEYENLGEELQKRFNSILKFAKEDISIRIGIRSEGIFTTETVNDIEYLRENHDYFLASLDKDKDINKIKKYFFEVAQRRFEKANYYDNKGNIKEIKQLFGDKEDLDAECKSVCGTSKHHLDTILKVIPELSVNDKLRKEIINIIKNDDNPIAETLNALWVVRGVRGKRLSNRIELAYYAASAMKAYFKGSYHEGVKTYKDHYSNKYRYAITVFICSVYKKDKLYYGFNAICHLSEGNTRTFINFCQSIINDALFYEKNTFINDGIISNQIQSQAIRKFARSEFDSICSVVYAGDKIKRMVSNLGNSFSYFHKDRRVRYPETTQFSYDSSKLNKEDEQIIKTAESWAIIIKKPKEQRVSAGINDRTELWHLNKMFAPLFNISYRIRGGVNLVLSSEEIHNIINSDSYYPIIVKRIISGQDTNEKKAIVDDINAQISFFDEV